MVVAFSTWPWDLCDICSLLVESLERKEREEEGRGTSMLSYSLLFLPPSQSLALYSHHRPLRNMARLCTAVVGIMLMIIELEVSYRDWEAEGTRINFPTLYHTLVPQIFKVFITINSVALSRYSPCFLLFYFSSYIFTYSPS